MNMKLAIFIFFPMLMIFGNSLATEKKTITLFNNTKIDLDYWISGCGPRIEGSIKPSGKKIQVLPKEELSRSCTHGTTILIKRIRSTNNFCQRGSPQGHKIYVDIDQMVNIKKEFDCEFTPNAEVTWL